MKYGNIPTWEECSDMQDALDSSDRTVNQAINKPCLDPVEQFIFDNEPAGLVDTNKFRDALQKLVDFLGEDKTPTGKEG